MDTLTSSESGFSLVEVLISLGILLVFLPFAASMLTNSQLLASYTKHKMEAAFAAQQIIEAKKQAPFVVLGAGQQQTTGPSSVLLDTKGNYNNTACNAGTAFCGTATVTITPTVYTNLGGGTQPPSAAIDHVVVTISWIEQIVNLKVPMSETYAEDIINDPMLN